MSEYFLADLKAEERARQRNQMLDAPVNTASNREMKVTLLGDFLYSSVEPQGCDPYNNVQGKPVIDAWQNRRDRR